MKSIYVLVPRYKITQAMISRSNSLFIDDMPGIAIGIFRYHVMEVPEERIVMSTVFDKYPWFDNKDQLKKFIFRKEEKRLTRKILKWLGWDGSNVQPSA